MMMKTLLSSSVSYPMVVSSKSFLIKKMRLKFLSAVFFHSTVSRRIFEFFTRFLHCFFCSARRMGTNTTPEFGFGQDDEDDDDDDVWANVDAR